VRGATAPVHLKLSKMFTKIELIERYLLQFGSMTEKQKASMIKKINEWPNDKLFAKIKESCGCNVKDIGHNLFQLT
jgi:hypothetical protein